MRLLIVLLVLSLSQVNGNDLDEYDLKEKLMLKYNRGSKPTEQTNVTINIQLVNLDFKEQVSHVHICSLKLPFSSIHKMILQTLEFTSWYSIQWIDKRLSWDQDRYNISSLRFFRDEVCTYIIDCRLHVTNF